MGNHARKMPTFERVILGISIAILIGVVLSLGHLMITLGMSLLNFILIILACQALSHVLVYKGRSFNFLRRNHGKHRR